jgi:peptidoglycan/LPS O-acetylase OafA/YrhL
MGYRPALDGVRGIAIAMVVSTHAFGWPHQGSLGVDVFFVLSGFLITTLLLDEQKANGRISLRAFYARRARRLLPALFTMLAVYTVGMVAVFAARGELDLVGQRLLQVGLVVGYLANFANLTGFAGDVPLSLGHMWSLAQEEQFYALWPLLLIVLLRRRPSALAGSLTVLISLVMVERFALAAAGASPFVRIYLSPDTHSEPILVGCLTAALLAGGKLRHPSSLAAAGSLVAVLAAAVWASRWASALYATPLFTLFAAAVSVVIVDATVGQSLVARVLAAGPLRYLGKISYALYLWHLPMLIWFGTLATPGLRSVVALAVAVFLACVSRYVVELPGQRRRRRPHPVAVPAAAPA